MRWEKLGLVYVPNGEYDWAQAHAFLPTSLAIDEERIRVYSAVRDRENVGRVAFVDVDARDPTRILYVSDQPALDIGEPGTFDDNGVSPISLVKDDNKLYLYYIGWQLGVKVRYFLLVGLAVSDDGGRTFQRCSRVPVLERSDGELFVRSASVVLRDDERWKMWYVAGDRWLQVGDKSVPTYNVRYLESPDKERWGTTGRVCLDLAEGSDEFGFGRPFVIKQTGFYQMFYSIRTASKGYRLGYAESPDGLTWERKDDEVGINVSPAGWDSEMVCYSCIQQTKYGTYMFYNGNNYGETGFGAAVLAG